MASSTHCTWGLPTLLIVALGTLSLHRVHAQIDVLSCGGFVSVAPDMNEALQGLGEAVDLSQVRIQLFNNQGAKKSEGDCSPNGYYFVPVDAGTYTVRVHGPPGWVFSPREIEITCRQESCNDGNDVNFELTGLQLTGHVAAAPAAPSCKAAAGVFSGISITVNAAETNSKASAVVRTADSSFNTGPLLPGEYIITAAHPDWKFSPVKMTHMLGLNTAQLQQPFMITGYKVSGSVTSRSGPVAGIQVTLLSADDVTVGCSTKHPPGSVDAGDIESALSTTALCSVVTDAQGQYSFTGVPCGQYTLQAHHPDTHSTFAIEPSSITVDVGHGNAVVQQSFSVTGFSVQGRVVDSAGVGIAGVDIIVGGETRATTDLTGRYVLPRMNEGKLDVSAARKHYTFTSLKAVHITPSSQILPDITAKSVALCGRITYGDERFKVNARRVSLTSTDGGSSTQQTTADAAAGNFCFMVPPGRYRVAPYVTSDEKNKGLVMSPSHSDVEVIGEPVLNVVFSQAQLTVTGSVECLDGPCPADVRLSLKTAEGKVATLATLEEIAVKTEQSIGNGVAFQFSRVSPGHYSLTASKPGWCWSDSEVRLMVESDNVTAPALRQAGYQLQITSSHPADLRIQGSTAAEPITVHVEGGSSSSATVCLPASGTYTIAPKSCYVFGQDPNLTLDVAPMSKPEPVTVHATKVLIKGSIAVAEGTATPPSSITIAASAVGTDPTSFTTTQAVSAAADSTNAAHMYTYTLAIDLGATVTITPSVADQDSMLLFYPKSRMFTNDAAAKTCPEDVPMFEAKVGQMLTGVTEPAVEGAIVIVTFKSESAAAGSTTGATAVQGSTDASGSFSLGPLYDDSEYNIELSKPGHIFTPAGVNSETGQLKFTVKKLAQVSVSVELPTGTDPSAVFLSLSGSGGFKNNARLGADRTLTFTDLQPGTYYLKPLLREHQFEPPVADLALEDGQLVDITLTAVRNAWGLSGAVTSVSGAPLAGAVVEVCQGSGAGAVVLDSSITDEAGLYRIGSLRADLAYEVRVRLDGRVISAHPLARQVNMERADVSGIDFIAFRTSSRSALSAGLRLPTEFRNAIKAELYPAGAAASRVAAVASVTVDGSGFFEMRGLKPGSYVLKLSCDPAAAGGMSCAPWEMQVQVPNKDLHLGVLPYTASPLPTTSSTVVSAVHLSDEGLDWKVPVVFLVLLLAGSATVFKPAIIDIFQLRPALSTVAGTATDVPAGFAPPPQQSTANTGRTSWKAGTAAAEAAAARSAAVKAAAVSSLPSAVAAAAAEPLPEVADDSATGGSTGWVEESEPWKFGQKQRGTIVVRNRSRRA